MLIRSLFLVALFARVMNAQATITGIVHDSIAGTPLAGAEVQLVPANNPALLGHSATSDSLGRFTLAAVPKGRYALGFLHPMLDSLGVDLPPRELFVDDSGSIRADLAIPAGARLRTAICGPRAVGDSVGVVVGIVRDAQSHTPVAGAAVAGEWLELTFRAGGFVRNVPRLVATTGDNGWFAICNVPSGGNMTMVATRGGDSTGVVEVQIPAQGFLRRDLYLGPTQTVAVEDNTPRSDTSAAVPPRRIHVGDARLTGTVVAAVGGKALAAVVGIVNGPQTRANERGEWTLVNAPVGTRTLEVRALGYYPVRRVINVVASGPPVRIALSTMKAVLDTVRISATRTYDRNMIDFEKRRRSALGKYLTAADIARHAPVVTSDIFRLVPGVYVDRSPLGETMLMVRGMFSERCSPNVYIDDRFMWDMTADALDDYVKPERIAGIEVYNGAMVPPQFQPGLSGCGSIVIWTK